MSESEKQDWILISWHHIYVEISSRAQGQDAVYSGNSVSFLGSSLCFPLGPLFHVRIRARLISLIYDDVIFFNYKSIKTKIYKITKMIVHKYLEGEKTEIPLSVNEMIKDRV